MFNSSDLEQFRASGRSKSMTVNTPLTKNSQIITNAPIATSNQMVAMDSSFPTLSLDIGIEKLIDEVCSSELNTPDISVFDAFGSQNDHDFSWPESPLPVDKSSTDKNLLTTRQELFSLSPTSPGYYIDNETYEVEEALKSQLEDDNGSTLNTEKFNSSISSTFETVNGIHSTPRSKFEITFRDLVMDSDLANENNVSLPLIPDTVYDSLLTPNSAQHLQDDYSQEYSNFYHLTNQNLIRANETTLGQENISTLVPKLTIKYEDDLSRLCYNDKEFDLETIDQRALDDINDEVAMDSISNILSDGFQEAGLDKESLSSKEIQDKVNSFLNDSFEPIGLSKISSFQPKAQTTGNTQIVCNASLDILKSFKSSPFGKICNGAVLKNVKIMVPSEYKNHFAASQTSKITSIPVKNPHFTIKSIDTTNLNNKGATLIAHSTANKLVTSLSNSQIKLAEKIKEADSTTNCNIEAFKPINIPSTSKVLTNPLLTSGFSDSGCRKRRKKSLVTNYSTMSTSRDNDYESDLEFSQEKKRSKLSLRGLSEADKYRRIREQNNIASKKCRERKKKSISYLASEEEELSKKNTILKVEHDRLTASLKNWKLLWKSVAERSAAVSY